MTYRVIMLALVVIGVLALTLHGVMNRNRDLKTQIRTSEQIDAVDIPSANDPDGVLNWLCTRAGVVDCPVSENGA